ncbi:MAG: ComC/BlpC family leader-containing pheromone/bacteriocin [Bacteroidales bacterium]|nr:ComC/BlpC family leader-containing pheromone/bacteriocin [Bacteroidales bacterium]
MKTLKKRRQKNVIEKFSPINSKELQQIKGGEGEPTQRDIVFPR